MYPAKRITEYAKEEGIEDIVVEKRERFPFLQVLNFLNQADRVMLIGSTEKHYTASKTFQCLLSGKPLFAMLHKDSSASKMLKETDADQYLYTYQEKDRVPSITEALKPILADFIEENNWNPTLAPLEKYSAKRSAEILSNAMNRAIQN
jgi:hypothetical protein